jgi:hypothetical protein
VFSDQQNFGSAMKHIDQTAFYFKADAPAPLSVFRARAWAVAQLIENHFLADKQSAVDGLWRYAEGAGLVTELGVDRVQAILAEAFREC